MIKVRHFMIKLSENSKHYKVGTIINHFDKDTEKDLVNSGHAVFVNNKKKKVEKKEINPNIKKKEKKETK